MVAISLPRWLRALYQAGVAALGLLLSAVLVSQASATEIHYLRDKSFRVPFVISPAQQRQIRQVVLHVSEDFGKTYKIAAQAAPTDTFFLVQAPHEGWFWFTVQAQYPDGRGSPADPYSVQPGLKICVDTTPPLVNVHQTPAQPGALAIEWDIRDNNPDTLDLLTLRVEYRPVGSVDFIPLTVSQVPAGQYTWTPTLNAAQYEVHLQVRDRSGNQTDKNIRLTPGQVRQQQSFQTPDTGGAGKITIVNTRRIKLNYDLTEVGKSNVAGIQVWMTTTPTTQDWKMFREDPPNQEQAITVEVPGDGRYGFTLIARSGVGRAERTPLRGDQPDYWVEVDETKPVVQILSVDVSGTKDFPQLTIRWRCQDKNLAERPYTLSHSTAAEGPWEQIVTGLAKETNQYLWVIPTTLPHHQYYIRVEAIDQAGNVGQALTDKAVVVDLSTPRARVRSVEGAPSGTPPPANPGTPGIPGAMNTMPGAGVQTSPATVVTVSSPPTAPLAPVQPTTPPAPLLTGVGPAAAPMPPATAPVPPLGPVTNPVVPVPLPVK